MRTTSSTTGRHTGEPVPQTAVGSAPERPANRAERRAAARGRTTGEHAAGPGTPRSSGPAPRVKPAHVRSDFAARRTG